MSEEENHNHYAKYVKEHLNHSVEYGKKIMSTAHNVHSEITKKITDVSAHNLSLGKSYLNCTNFNEIIDWSHNFINSNVNHFIEGASTVYSKTCDEMSKANSEITKKVGENFANIKNKFHK